MGFPLEILPLSTQEPHELTTGFLALEVLEDGEGNESPQSLIVLGEEFIAEQGPLEDEEEEEELSELESLVSDIMHIITCLYKFSITIQNPAPKERLHKIAHIDVSYFEPWDIKHIEEKFRPVDPQNNFRVANYLSARLGQANTKRRQLLKYRQTHHNKIALYIDDPLPLKGAMERNESKLVTPNTEYGSFMAPEKIPGLEKASTVYTTSKSETTLSTVKIELLRPVEIQRDEDQLSQTSYATSINHTMRTWVPSPPNEITALQGEPFECPYCFTITKIRDRHDWKYVNTLLCSTCGFYILLNIIVGSMYLRIFNPMSAHSSTAPGKVNYMVANASGLIMRSNSTGEHGTVTPAQSLFRKRHYFKSI